MALEEGHEVIVVDQSTDRETERLTGELAGARYIRSGPGLSEGRNVAIRSTTATYLVFIDDDVSFPAGWVERVRGAFDEDPSIGAVCGRGRTQDGALLPGTNAGLYGWGTIPFGLGHGFNMAFRRELFETAGLFDGSLGAGTGFYAAEDSDLFYRLMRAGYKIACRDDITVVHHEWRTRREQGQMLFRYGVGAGAQTAKHLAGGDRAAARIALREAGRHLVTVVRSLVRLRVRIALLQFVFIGGMIAGYVRGRAARRGSIGEQPD